MPGKYPVGEKIQTLAGTTETIDLVKSARAFVGTITGGCVLTLSNPPQGFTELIFLLTNPHTNFDILGCLWTGGALTFTQTGVDYLKIGITRSGDTIVIFQMSKELALAAD
jgi:hypothetical protein